MPQTSPSNTIDFIEFPAASVQALGRAKAFFSQVFGWSYKNWGDDYCDTPAGGLASGINADPESRSAQPLVVIHVDDLEATMDKVKASGGTITRQPFSFPGGRRFHFKEPGGNELAAWSNR